MTTKPESEELKRALANRDYWQSFIKGEGWYLSGWSDRNSALFVRPGRGSVDVTASHLHLLGLENQDGVAK